MPQALEQTQVHALSILGFAQACRSALSCVLPGVQLPASKVWRAFPRRNKKGYNLALDMIKGIHFLHSHNGWLQFLWLHFLHFVGCGRCDNHHHTDWTHSWWHIETTFHLEWRSHPQRSEDE